MGGIGGGGLGNRSWTEESVDGRINRARLRRSGGSRRASMTGSVKDSDGGGLGK